jgi:hypothetical protein
LVPELEPEITRAGQKPHRRQGDRHHPEERQEEKDGEGEKMKTKEARMIALRDAVIV